MKSVYTILIKLTILFSLSGVFSIISASQGNETFQEEIDFLKEWASEDVKNQQATQEATNQELPEQLSNEDQAFLDSIIEQSPTIVEDSISSGQAAVKRKPENKQVQFNPAKQLGNRRVRSR